MRSAGDIPAAPAPDEHPDARLLEFARRHFSRNLRQATPSDVPDMARIHATSGTPGLLSDLGEGFLRDVFYAGLLESPLGRGCVVEIHGEIAGFETYSMDSTRLFSSIFRRRLRQTLVALVRAALRKPRVLFDFAQTVFSVEQADGSDIKAEAVSLEVAPAYQGFGLGFLLLQAAVDDLRASGAREVKARILAENQAVERLYPPLGFRRQSTFRLHGREWVLMVLDDAG